MITFIQSIPELKISYCAGKELWCDEKEIWGVLFKCYVEGSSIVTVVHRGETITTLVNFKTIFYKQ